jgi:hypothetical protein
MITWSIAVFSLVCNCYITPPVLTYDTQADCEHDAKVGVANKQLLTWCVPRRPS